MFARLTPLLILLATQCIAGCGSQSSYPMQMPVITGASVTPAQVHVGQPAVIHFALGRAWVPGVDGGIPAMSEAPRLEVNNATVVPLLDSVYTPGGPIPSQADAIAALEPFLHRPYDPERDLPRFIDANSAIDDVYLLFNSNLVGIAEITYFCGAFYYGFGPEEATRVVTIDVLPAP
jgi:hypothetical protein